MNKEIKPSAANWSVKVSVNVCCNHPFWFIFQKNGTQYKFDSPAKKKKSQNPTKLVYDNNRHNNHSHITNPSDNEHLLSTYYVSGTVIWIFHALTHVLFTVLYEVGTVFILMEVNKLLEVK